MTNNKSLDITNVSKARPLTHRSAKARPLTQRSDNIPELYTHITAMGMMEYTVWNRTIKHILM